MKMTVADILSSLRPCLSSLLVDRIVLQSGVSRENARKQVSRAVNLGQINAIKNIFPKREHFVYLQKDYGSKNFWVSLTEELLNSGSALGLAITSVSARGGVMPVAHFSAACGSPVAMQKRLTADIVMEKLVKLGLMKKVNLNGIGECIGIKEKDDRRYNEVARQVKARITTESVLIKAIVQWAQYLGIVSFDSVRTRIDEGKQNPAVSNFSFDITAPSYLSPLIQFENTGKVKPGFFACDLLLGVKVTLNDIKPFIAKCKTILTLKNVGKCIFMFTAYEYEKAAFEELKRNGIIPATPDNLFGKEITKTLVGLNEFLSHYFSNDTHRVEKIDDLMTKLSDIHGVAAQLQGALFEYLVAEVVRIDGGYIEIGRNCKAKNGKSADADVYISKRNINITFIECKGYKPYSEIDHKLVMHWVANQIPVFREQALYDDSRADVQVEFWTTGKLSNESKETLKKTMENNKINKRYSMVILEAHDVKKRFEQTKNKRLIEVYEKHFLQEFRPEKEGKHYAPAYRLTSAINYLDDD